MSKLSIIKKFVISIIIILFVPLFSAFIFLISLPFYEAYCYKRIIETSVNETNDKNKDCPFEEIDSYRYPLLTNGVSGYVKRYNPECSNLENKLYDELFIIMLWSPFSDLSKDLELKRIKDKYIKNTGFSDQCVFIEASPKIISLYCYNGYTEYRIRADRISNPARDEKQIKQELIEIHEIIRRELE